MVTAMSCNGGGDAKRGLCLCSNWVLLERLVFERLHHTEKGKKHPSPIFSLSVTVDFPLADMPTWERETRTSKQRPKWEFHTHFFGRRDKKHKQISKYNKQEEPDELGLKPPTFIKIKRYINFYFRNINLLVIK